MPRRITHDVVLTHVYDARIGWTPVARRPVAAAMLSDLHGEGVSMIRVRIGRSTQTEVTLQYGLDAAIDHLERLASRFTLFR